MANGCDIVVIRHRLQWRMLSSSGSRSRCTRCWSAAVRCSQYFRWLTFSHPIPPNYFQNLSCQPFLAGGLWLCCSRTSCVERTSSDCSAVTPLLSCAVARRCACCSARNARIALLPAGPVATTRAQQLDISLPTALSSSINIPPERSAAINTVLCTVLNMPRTCAWPVLAADGRAPPGLLQEVRQEA